MKDHIVSVLIGVFATLGGIPLVLHLVAKHAPEYLLAGVLWLYKRYPAIKATVAKYGPDIKQFLQDLEKAEEAAVDASSDPNS